MKQQKHGHAPQDFLYGPLKIPDYCWPIIDTREFQRLRYVKQLGPTCYVWPGANHTRFEHALGCCHLACIFMTTLRQNQPELKLKDEQVQAVIIAALCRELGRGPFSHTFDPVARSFDPDWTPVVMAERVLNYIWKQHKIDLSETVIKAAGSFILGYKYDDWPKWLSTVVSNRVTRIDLNTFDYLIRDNKRTLNSTMSGFDRLFSNCRVIDGKLSYKLSEVPTIECLFFTRNTMYKTVYYHKAGQAIEFMIQDIFRLIAEDIHLEESLRDVSLFVTLDDRIMVKVEAGLYGTEAKKIAEDIASRNLYRSIGLVHVKPDDSEGERYSQNPPDKIAGDICDCGRDVIAKNLRVVKMQYTYGLRAMENPLTRVLFWKCGTPGTFNLKPEDISCISPSRYAHYSIRVFIIKRSKPRVEAAVRAFEEWKKSGAIQ